MKSSVLFSMTKRKNYVVLLNLSFVLILIFSFQTQQNQNQNQNQYRILKRHSQTFKALSSSQSPSEKQSCNGFHGLEDHIAKCSYLKSQTSCVNQGYLDYLYLFYCYFGAFQFLGYSLLTLWLLILFYLLGNTASEYFCSSLESLSKLFNLSPTIAGVTLLSLGNGAPDVFASLVSFTGDGGTSEIGFNTVLGGASVITCVVVGVMSISLRNRRVRVNKSDFVRDVFFLLLVLLCLAVILVQKEIDLWGAMIFFSIYIVYVIVVYVLHIRSKNNAIGSIDSGESSANDLTVPILINLEKGQLDRIIVESESESESVSDEEAKRRLRFRAIMFVLESPLYLPRRLTIPVICEDKWCKFYAVTSVTLAPLLLAAIASHEIGHEGDLSFVFFAIALVLGTGFGIMSYVNTESSTPPKNGIFPWLVAGFVMSVTWSYITAQELVGLLVSLAYILGVNPSILGLTVLAWGNSIGDLVTNLTMALNSGQEGAQTAFSGCYAGPIFNTLFGLGLSLIGYCWSKYPSPVTVPRDPYLLQTLGFLAVGLFWALVVLPRRDMRLDWVFGIGLLIIYTLSISLSLFQAFGYSSSSHLL